MVFANKKTNQALTSSAEVVDGHLILSATNAVEPVVWRMALADIGTATFEIKAVKGGETHKLMLKPQKGTAEAVATFENKDDALTALLQTSEALQNVGGGGHAPSPTTETATAAAATHHAPPVYAGDKNGNLKWLYLLIGLLVLVALYVLLSAQVPTTPIGAGGVEQAPIGVPLSADDYLSGF